MKIGDVYRRRKTGRVYLVVKIDGKHAVMEHPPGHLDAVRERMVVEQVKRDFERVESER